MPLPRMRRDTHKFVRTNNYGYITLPATDTGLMRTWALSDLTASSDFTGLFDYYRISKVVLRFTWAGSGVPVSLYITSDFDGGTAPTGTEMNQRRHITFVLGPTTPSANFSITPKLALSVGVAGATTAISGISSSWVDVASPSTVFYGASIFLLNYNTTVNSGGRIILQEDYYLQCAGLR